MQAPIERVRSACDDLPLRQGGGASALVGLAVDEVSFEAEVVVDVGVARWRERLFSAMVRNAEQPMTFLCLPINRVVELGSQVEI